MRTLNLLFFIILIYLFSGCQEPEEELELLQGEITNELHQANVGKIMFLDRDIPYEDLTQKDFINSFQMTPGARLDARLYLKETRTWSLHQLAPELTANQLCKKGSIQFTFYVDGKNIYTDKVRPGAGSCFYRNSRTVFWVPFVNDEPQDFWSYFMWMRFMKKGGGEQALSEGNHHLKMEIRPYIKDKVGAIIAEGELEIQVVNKEVTEEEIAVQPILPNAGFPAASIPIKTEKIKELNKAIAQLRFKKVTSIVVLKNGELMLEEYFNGANRATLHDTRSVGKSFVATMAGIAIEEGHIKNDQRLSAFYDLKTYKNYSAKKEKITVHQLLSHTSGLTGNDMDPDSPGNEEKMYPTDNWVKFTLDLPMDPKKTPGTDWDYLTAGSVLLGDMLHKKVPGGLEEYTQKKLFDPLGIKNHKWQYTPQKVVNTAGSLQLSALDFAKYGQLYKNGGTWDNQQILPKEWTEKSMSKQAVTPKESGGSYGYQFWGGQFTYNGKEMPYYKASGNGGNQIIVFKDQPLVIVITAQAYNMPYAHPQADQMVLEYILPAVL